MDDPTDAPVSRRHLLRKVAAGLGLAAAAEVLTARPAAAAGPVVGDSATADPAVRGTNTSTGVGVWGEITNSGSDNSAVYGVTNGTGASAAVFARANGEGRALYAETNSTTGEVGAAAVFHKGIRGPAIGGVNSNGSNLSAAVAGSHVGIGPGMHAFSQTGTAIVLNAVTGAHLRLIPSRATTPVSAQDGDVFLGTDGGLFLSKFGGNGAAAWMRVGFNPIDPTRIVDTRAGAPPDPSGEHALAAGEELLVSVIGVAGIPTGATAVTLNVTAVGPSAVGFLSLYPANLTRTLASPPTFSNLNFTPGVVVANAATVKIAPPGTANAGKIKVFNSAGNTHVILDVAGFYS
jgi:hypothetical protein